ncbi:hypothetical protein LOAG_09470 [Loa loa]|uniref:Uncharacterized protein n=1 Tax=Loa loa TaxID=7209 RepID=A0A1S0TT34_LOALO|nr:hypothetical protein LOAG_09470 [Loa loa]EFO19025.2 hypothetical protein LOAG_09470 [Loa loa]
MYAFNNEGYISHRRTKELSAKYWNQHFSGVKKLFHATATRSVQRLRKKKDEETIAEYQARNRHLSMPLPPCHRCIKCNLQQNMNFVKSVFNIL